LSGRSLINVPVVDGCASAALTGSCKCLNFEIRARSDIFLPESAVELLSSASGQAGQSDAAPSYCRKE
jgi:hypothetical protein